MAFRPSLRSSRTFAEQVEINLFPVMNLMVVLIPLLLSTVTFVRIGVIQLDLPPATLVPSDRTTGLPREEERTLDLAVTITDRGFYISSALGVLRAADGGPYIPKKLGAEGVEVYDFDRLSSVLAEIKSKAQGRFRDDERVIIQAEPSVRYQVVVSTMDAARSYQVEGRTVSLFPQVALAAGVR
ncbi:MAG: biopolymer transporter ExbD [candidate division KSB1 bacterium]|nr:biopolymer transporter ExbD [candidate division KSB1 bacterium]